MSFSDRELPRNGSIIASVERSVGSDRLRDVHGDMNLFSFSASGVVTQLTDTVDDDYAPDVSPDGRYIAFTRGLSSNGALGDIYVLDARSNDVTNLTQTPGLHEYGPTWSPDGETIAFSRSEPDTPGGDFRNDDLYAIAAMGGEPVRLTDGAGIEMGPAWSPDGKAIAYLEHGLGGPWVSSGTAVHIVAPDGSEDETILTDDRYLTALSWSRDGTRLVATMVPSIGSSGYYSIWLLERDGSDFTEVFPRENVIPTLATWSPDGKWIGFIGSSGGVGGFSRLYKMRPDGSQVTPISNLNLSTASQESLISGLPWKIAWGPRP